jgi:predicted ATPase
MNYLDSVSIKGYKSIKFLENFKLQRINILIGANGAGKSNFIGLFEFVHDIIKGNLQRHVSEDGGADSILFFGRKKTDKIQLGFNFDCGNKKFNRYFVSLIPAKEKLVIEREETGFQDEGRGYKEPYINVISKFAEESSLKDAAQETQYNIHQHVSDSIASWKVFHFHDTSKTSKMKGLSKIDDNESLRPDASNLSAVLYFLQKNQPNKYKQLVDVIRLVAPYFDDFTLRKNPSNNQTIKIEWKEKGSDLYFDAYNLSDGTIRFICLATLLHLPEPPAIIIIDEPEIGLHPYAIEVLANLIKTASTNTQFVISTQSGTFLDYFDPESIIVVDNRNGESVFNRLPLDDLKEWLHDYSVGELWEKNNLGGRPNL